MEVSILIVADNITSLAVTESILCNLFPFAKVRTARSFFEAKTLIALHKHNVVLTDCRPSGKHDGILLASQISGEAPDTAVILVTTDDVSEVRSLHPGVSVHAVVQKPLDVDVLAETVRAAICKEDSIKE